MEIVANDDPFYARYFKAAIISWFHLVACLLFACGPVTLTPSPILATLAAPTPAHARLRFDIVDDATGQPITAQISIRREKLHGTLIDTQPTL